MLDNSFSLRKAAPTGPKNISGHRRRQTHPPGAPGSRYCRASSTFPTGFQPDYPKSLRAPARMAPALSPAAAPRAPLALPRHNRSAPAPQNPVPPAGPPAAMGLNCPHGAGARSAGSPRRSARGTRPGAPEEQPRGPGHREGSHHGTDGGESPHRHQRLHPPPAAAILGRD